MKTLEDVKLMEWFMTRDKKWYKRGRELKNGKIEATQPGVHKAFIFDKKEPVVTTA